MKRILLVISAILFLAGCSQIEAREDDERINIVVAIFPQYDWVRQIIGEENERFNLTFLLNTGIDTHSFNPSIADIARIKTSDVFMYVGGHSDGWVYDVLASPDVNPDMLTHSLMGALEGEDLMEGFCDDPDCDEDHEHVFHLDEHVWMSLRFAQIICVEIANILAEIDPENADVYKANLEAYLAKLAALDAEYQAAVDAANVTTLVFADRFPFRYLLNDYGLTHYAAFRGCTAEAEASFVTVVSLANRLNQLGLNFVMVTETSDKSIARTVINSTDSQDQQILVLDAIKSVTQRDADNVTYLSIMESNLEVLRQALAN